MSTWPSASGGITRPAALLLDAGNTLVFLDLHAVATAVGSVAEFPDVARLRAAEAPAKRAYEARLEAGASHEDGWRLYMATLLEAAGAPATDAVIGALVREHASFNLWRRVPDGLRTALASAREAGVRLGVVSNSEGALPRLFERVGLSQLFEVVVDSHHEGIRKPDPEIFRRALSRMRIDARDALYAGDLPRVDLDGARAAGLSAALIDPFGFFPDESPRFDSVVTLVEALGIDPAGA